MIHFSANMNSLMCLFYENVLSIYFGNPMNLSNNCFIYFGFDLNIFAYYYGSYIFSVFLFVGDTHFF